MRRALALALAAACSSPPAFPTARFANQPPATIVDDRHDVASPPKARVPHPDVYWYQVLFERVVTRTFDLPRPVRAQGVSSTDEVPDSTWFTNRIDLTPAQIRTGPVTIESPELHLPWTITSTKSGGSSIGFLFRDARGVKYLLKFDDKAYPEIETGADVVTDRLLWATGYNVPENQIVYFRSDDLRIAPDAKLKDEAGTVKGKLDRAKVAEKLALVARERDGRIRGLASRWLDGEPLGDPPSDHVRHDDPNDRIRHDRRRDLRALYVVYAWLDVVDVWAGNFLDVWTPDPHDPKHHYVVHYLLDFGGSLGTMGTKTRDLRHGYTYELDWPAFWSSLFTGGVLAADWEVRPKIDIPGVPTLFSEIGFDPGGWHPDLPYLPFQAMDRFDAFWAAKVVARFTREQIHAAVEAGRFSNPQAVEYLTDTLVARQRKTAEYWYQRVNPLDHFAISGGVCFDDLAIAQRVVAADTSTHYVIAAHDVAGRPVGRSTAIAARPGGHSCAPFAVAAGHDGYTIIQITTIRGGFRATTYVHVARGPSGRLRVIGVWRV